MHKVSTLFYHITLIAVASNLFLLYANQYYLIEQLYLSAPITQQHKEHLATLPYTAHSSSIKQEAMYTLPLFTHYTLLQNKIAHIPLGTFPTPLYAARNMPHFTSKPLYIKCDGMSGKTLADGTQLFGGNKVRKLEFALADALKQDCSAVLTFGGVGSNHALTTTIYARALGLQSICLLSDQPGSAVVQRNLLLQHYYGADMHFFPTEQLRNQAAYSHIIEHYKMHNSFPYVIPVGASYVLGSLGFVNAAFELYEQIKTGLMPVPDIIYLPAGSLGTMAGLLVGIKALGLSTKIIGVAVEPDPDSLQAKKTLDLAKKTNDYLHSHDPSFPLFDWQDNDVIILMDFTGPCYGAFTPEGENAVQTLQRSESIILDSVYTGKAFAALLRHAKHGFLDNKTVLFWNTFCAESFAKLIETIDYTTLKKPFWHYF